MQSKVQQDLLDRFLSGELIILVEDIKGETELNSTLFGSEKDGGLGFEENTAMTRSVITDRGTSYFVKIWSDKTSVGVVFKSAAFIPKDENVIKAEDFVKCMDA